MGVKLLTFDAHLPSIFYSSPNDTTLTTPRQRSLTTDLTITDLGLWYMNDRTWSHMTALDLRLGMSMGFTALLVLLPRRIWMTSGRHLDIIPSLVAFLGRFFIRFVKRNACRTFFTTLLRHLLQHPYSVRSIRGELINDCVFWLH
jgi:hypothetical protein